MLVLDGRRSNQPLSPMGPREEVDGRSKWICAQKHKWAEWVRSGSDDDEYEKEQIMPPQTQTGKWGRSALVVQEI
ncbi:unnamed protein product [Diplocarpon coronariae]